MKHDLAHETISIPYEVIGHSAGSCGSWFEPAEPEEIEIEFDTIVFEDYEDYGIEIQKNDSVAIQFNSNGYLINGVFTVSEIAQTNGTATLSIRDGYVNYCGNTPAQSYTGRE